MRPTAPLLVLTIGQGLATGIIVTYTALRLAGYTDATLVVMALVAAAAGGVGSFFHMHRLKAARYVLRRLKTSWLSREALTTGLFGGALAILLVWSYGGFPSGAALTVFTVLTAALGLVAVWVTAMLYATIRAMLSWNTPLTVVAFLIVSLLSGSTAALAVRPMGHHADTGLGLAIMAVALATGAVKLVQLQYFRRARERLGQDETSLPFSPYRLHDTGTSKPPYRVQTQVWPTIAARTRRIGRALVFILQCAAPAVFAAIAAFSGGWLWGVAAGASALAGTIADRWLFFADAVHSSLVFFPDGAGPLNQARRISG